ncbi:MAG TPA: methionine--tRNA ligase [Thermoplasmatales archaeon]|nr:methionine--tRNA ligase [Thermoplasmatales archaeon]
MERIFIGVAWPYANGSLHLGTLAGALLPGDIFGRYHRMKGNEVLMVSGSDEHGTPITITAEKEGVEPKEIADKYHEEHKRNLDELGIKFENFSRTSNEFHKKVVKDFLVKLYDNGYIYPKKVQSFYCEKCKRFLPDRYVEGVCIHCGGRARGDQCEECGRTLDVDEIKEPKCKICGSIPFLKETEHLFFKLSYFEEKLMEWLKDKNYWRDNVINFTINFIKSGLKDRAITRDLEWGVEVPIEGYENKRIYVWFEAVIGYLHASMEWAEKTGKKDEWKKWWVEEAKHYYFLAKDNIPFHTIIWPSMLMAHGGLNLPYDVPANEYLTLSGEQFSKSRGVGIWIPDILKNFNADAVRYYLSINMPEKRDTDWKWEDFMAKVNNELVAIYGNFIHRVLTFSYKNFRKIPPYLKRSERDSEIIEEVKKNFEEVGECIEKCHFKEGMKKVMRMAQIGNQYINENEPWKLINEDVERCKSVMHTCIKIVKMLAFASAPYMPKTAEKIWRMLGYKDSIHEHRWSEAEEINENEIEKPLPLFRKIEMKEQRDPFSLLDLRVAKIINVEDHPNADKLYIMDVDVGKAGKRRIVAGIKKWYKKEDLTGKKIVLLANLEPAKIRGVESDGMLLAVDKNGEAILLVPNAEEGERVYVDGITPSPPERVSYDEFKNIKIVTKNGLIEYNGKILMDKNGAIKIDHYVEDGYNVR